MLKVNEFTLAGAVLADSLAGVRTKRKGGEPTHSSPKSATFSKEYNSSRHACRRLLRQILSPYRYAPGLQNDRLAITRHNSPRHTLRPGYTTPMQYTGCGESLSYSLCLKVSSFQSKNKSDTQRVFTLILADTSKLFLDIKKAWS